jgi:PAS domain S-box-containing protein
VAERRNGGERRREDRRADQSGKPDDGDTLRAIVDSSDDAIMSKDLEGKITSWNLAAEHLYGYAPGEVIGQNIAMLVPAGHEDEEHEILRRVGVGEKIERYITMRRHRDGHMIEVLLSVSPVRDGNGAIVGASSISHEASSNDRLNVNMELLARRVHDLKNNIGGLTDSLDHFQTADQVTATIGRHQDELKRTVNLRTALGALLAIVIASGVGGGSAWMVQRQAHRDAVVACQQRADSNQAIRDIVDKSQSVQIDPLRLSPTAREILGEFARAQQQGGQQSLRDFVYTKTPIPDCSNL